MKRDNSERWVRSEERAQVLEPRVVSDCRSGQRDRAQQRTHLRELTGERRETVAVRPSPYRVAGVSAIPGELPVHVGLIADLQGLDVAPPDSRHQRAALSRGSGGIVGLRFAAEDWPGPAPGGGRFLRGQPPRREAVA